jgi:putative ABC transport system permease protein
VFGLALRGVRHNASRYIATLVAIITGVAFFAAAGFVSAGITDALEGDVDRQFANVDVAVVADDSVETAEPLTLPGDAVERILAVDGVEAGGGVVTGPVAFLAPDGRIYGDGTTGRLWIVDADLNPLDVDEGRAPEAAGEVAISRDVASEEGISVGDEVTVLSVSGERQATVVGTTEFGDDASLDGGGTLSISANDVFDWLRDGRVEYDAYYLRTDGGGVTDAVAAVVPAGFETQTGEQFRADEREKAGSIGRYLGLALQAFALLAMFVGGFVIYNTFSVIVAQRQRELAVLSAIGATPKQIKRSLRFEGLVIGVLGSVLGVIAGIALAVLLGAIISLVGAGLPGGGLKVEPPAVIGGIVLGTLITLFSVMIPARRAARIEPIEALRDAAAETGALSRKRGIVAAVLVLLGLGGLFLATSPVGIGFGVLLLIVGIIVAGPFIAAGGAGVLRPVLSKLGLEGRLAVDNSTRNPKRTATTANALLIGVFLVTFVTVAGTSMKDFVVSEIQKLESADYLISSDGGTIDAELVQQLEGVEGVNRVVPYRRESITLDGEPSLLSTADGGGLVEVTNISAKEGSLDELVPGTVAVTSLDEVDREIGSTVTVADTDGNTVDLEVVAVLDVGLDASALGNLVDPATFDKLVGDTAPTAAFVDAESGDESDTKDAIDAVVARRPDITVTEGNAIGALIGGVFDFLINAVNGLLLMSVVVALIGIVNTLSLSILERRRELGLLRIMGMVDRKVQRMVRLESGLIAALGTVTGMVLGLVIGWGLIASIDRLTDAGIGFGFPTGQLLLVLVAGVVLGVLASVIPARRSTRLTVLEAVQAT